MAFASWWYKTVNRSGRPGQDREGKGRKGVRFAFLGVRTRYCPGFGGEGVEAGCDLRSCLQARLRERPGLTLPWYVGARPDVQVRVSRCTGLSSCSELE